MKKNKIFIIIISLLFVLLIPVKTNASSLSEPVTTFNSKLIYQNDIYYSNINLKDELDNYDSVFLIKSNLNITEDESKTSLKEKIKTIVKGERNIIIVDTVAKYYFKNGTEIVEGNICAPKDITKSNVLNKVKEIQSNINNDAMFANSSINNSNLCVDGAWETVSESKWDFIMNNGNKHYGDFSEWKRHYKLAAETGREYHAFVYESYIKPDSYKTNFRTEKLTYIFDPTLATSVELRDYAPKIGHPEGTIEYGINVCGGINSNGGANLGGSISNSYSTALSSPVIFDNGNMLHNYVEIQMNYEYPEHNEGQYYLYNTSQSYQSMIAIIKTPISNFCCIQIQDNRLIKILNSNFWYNRSIEFKHSHRFDI